MASFFEKYIASWMLPALIVSGGVEAQLHSQQLRDNAKKINEQSQKLKDTYNNIISGIATLDETIKQEILDSYDNIRQLSAQIDVSHQEYKKAYRNIQIGGIFLVSLIFILLVLKEYGLLAVLWELIKWPFVQIASLFGGNKEIKK